PRLRSSPVRRSRSNTPKRRRSGPLAWIDVTSATRESSMATSATNARRGGWPVSPTIPAGCPGTCFPATQDCSSIERSGRLGHIRSHRVAIQHDTWPGQAEIRGSKRPDRERFSGDYAMTECVADTILVNQTRRTNDETRSPADPRHGETVGSFADVVLPHLDAAYNLARWLVRNETDAEDVVQDAYVRALRYFGNFRGGDARAW